MIMYVIDHSLPAKKNNRKWGDGWTPALILVPGCPVCMCLGLHPALLSSEVLSGSFGGLLNSELLVYLFPSRLVGVWVNWTTNSTGWGGIVVLWLLCLLRFHSVFSDSSLSSVISANSDFSPMSKSQTPIHKNIKITHISKTTYNHNHTNIR